MRRRGSMSWRFEEQVDPLLHAALYAREALGLEVQSVASAPPLLMSTPTTAQGVLSGVERGEASGMWLRWWQHLVQVRVEAAQEMAAGTWESDSGVRHPDDMWPTGGGGPLRRAVDALEEEARSWVRDGPRSPSERRSCFTQDQVELAVRQASSERHVPVGSLSVVVFVLAVRGVWWHNWSPGVLLCSTSMSKDTDAAQTALTEALCQHWLDGARARLETARSGGSAKPGGTTDG